jgi:hypothetical protein
MEHKKVELSELTVPQLRRRRHRLAGSVTGLEELLRGTLLTQGRRCGKESCRCAHGELHGPYLYLSVTRPGRRPRMVYVPADLADTVTGRVQAGTRLEAVMAEIAAINAELLARRALG